jgi:hypothetical protein
MPDKAADIQSFTFSQSSRMLGACLRPCYAHVQLNFQHLICDVAGHSSRSV